MVDYCQAAADDLGYAVLCPRQLPRPLTIIPCSGPPPEEPLWGEHCFDYVLDVLFRGSPGYQGPDLDPDRRNGHLAIWTIGPDSDFYPDAELFACPAGGERRQPERLASHDGQWWTCPAGHTANLNSGHVAFQWQLGDVVYGVSVHGITNVSRRIVRAQTARLALVTPS